MNKIVTIIKLIIVIVVIAGAVFIWKIFYAPVPNEPFAKTQELNTEQTTLTSVQTSQSDKTSTASILVNGKCGNSINSCTTGTFRGVAYIGTSYKWNCLGSNDGVTASCNIAKPPITPLSSFDRIEAAINAKLKK
jgi:cytoskeletal protein RodZ